MLCILHGQVFVMKNSNSIYLVSVARAMWSMYRQFTKKQNFGLPTKPKFAFLVKLTQQVYGVEAFFL